MTPAAQDRRGAYAKGVAKREEILQTALEVIAREGYRGASVKEIAEAVGLSQAGVLHYFDSKEELFTEVLRRRDNLDRADFMPGEGWPGGFEGMRESFVEVIRHNGDVPGLVQLFSRLAVDAADATHPAHAYFIERGRELREGLSTVIAEQQRAGTITDRIDAETLARVLQAVADGLQLQWALERDVDMAATMDALFAALLTEGGPARDA